MKRRQAREHDEEEAREQGARHRDGLLAELKAREAARRDAAEPAVPTPAKEPPGDEEA